MLIGRAVSEQQSWDPTREETTWIGKPWRRVELLVRRTFWKEEEVDVSRDLTLHLGLRRLGLAVTVILTRQSYIDYSECEHQ